jgi:hypothetical protein
VVGFLFEKDERDYGARDAYMDLYDWSAETDSRSELGSATGKKKT